MTDLGATPVVLYNAEELFEAEAVHNALEERGIPSRIEGEYLTTALGDVQIGDMSARRVRVRQEDVPTAQEVLNQVLAEARKAKSAPSTDQTCLACGADMTGTTRCPQCGWSYVANEPPSE